MDMHGSTLVYIYAKGLFLDLENQRKTVNWSTANEQLCNTHDEPNQWLPWDGISLDTESHNIFDELYEWGKNLKAWVGKPLGLITPHVKEKIKYRREIK